MWDCGFHWAEVKLKFIDEITSNTFNFQPLQKVSKSSDKVNHLWTSIHRLDLNDMQKNISQLLTDDIEY